MKKRVCLLIHSLGPGGMERVMSQIATYFSEKKGLDVHLVLYGMKREIFYPIPENIVIHKPRFEFKNSRRTWHTLKTLLFLRRTIKQIHPDSVLSFGEIWNNMVILSLLGLRYPVYVADRSRPGKDLGRLHGRLKRWLYPRASGLIVQTEKARKEAERTRLNANIGVIGNPIRAIEQNEGEGKDNIVLTVGRLIKTKHVDRLIRLFSSIDMPDWKLVIVGGNAQKQNLMAELKKLIEDLGVADRVFLEGMQADVDRYYRQARIFAFTSSSEGFPNVVGEALSAGLPVVSYDCVAGPSEMITNGENGYLVPVFDDELFAQKLRLLMENDALRQRMGMNARTSVTRFSVDTIGAQFHEFMMSR